MFCLMYKQKPHALPCLPSNQYQGALSSSTSKNNLLALKEATSEISNESRRSRTCAGFKRTSILTYTTIILSCSSINTVLFILKRCRHIHRPRHTQIQCCILLFLLSTTKIKLVSRTYLCVSMLRLSHLFYHGPCVNQP